MTVVEYDLHNLLEPQGFSYVRSIDSGFIYEDGGGTCIIIDVGICDLSAYQYVDYTSTQNIYVHNYDRLFRFLYNPDEPLTELLKETEFFLDGGEETDAIKHFGRNREEQDIDPSRPEAEFEDCFIAAFGEASRGSLAREFPYYDCDGKRRFVDYVLFAKGGKFAIELNGESFHHPAVIGPKRYRSQLFKQNSLTADGFKTFRWSLRGMADREKFVQELQRFLGDETCFLQRPHFKVDRQLATLDLHDHQIDTLEYLATERKNGRHSFLIVLPTGTGKTEIFIKDIESFILKNLSFKALILVPSRKLRTQTIARLKLRLPKYLNHIGDDLFSATSPSVVVQTYAFMHRHYYKIESERFNYIVVDEAHHAAAAGMRRVLEHFNPENLIGLTATPERFDRQNLEEIFGEYESPLGLADAVSQGLVPPIRCFRIKSNLDLSEVRFNGREYVKNDLQRTLNIPSRDQLIVTTLDKYFSGSFSHKQGVVFCVDIAHARRMAGALNSAGITALAVDGKDRRGADAAQQKYTAGEVRFLCACDLLTEGWDAPQTQILIMARPTFSKVLYTQQLGRGLRHYADKEALYVLDVVDNYGAKLSPMSLHALLGIRAYCPFADLINPEKGSPQDEIITLDGLYEGIRRIEPIDILTFDSLYGDFLNEEQLARELFVSTGSVKTWLKKKTITADYTHPFGRSTLHFFDPQKVEAIRSLKGLSAHTTETRQHDFIEFLEKRDYTFSYKIIFLLAFLKIRNSRGEASLPEVLDLYQQFYLNVYQRAGHCEKKKSPYSHDDFLVDKAELQANLLRNPFEKFERKRFFHHCRDLNYIAIDSVLQAQLTEGDYQSISKQMVDDLRKYFGQIEISLEDRDYDFLLATSIEDLPKASETKPRLNFIDNPPEDEQFTNTVPLYSLEIAAGSFLESSLPLEPESWLEMTGLTHRASFDDSMFVARIQGQSMEPMIPDGSYCLFTRNVVGTRQGRVILARHGGRMDEESGASFTVKRYHSTKRNDPDSEWTHESIVLSPENPDYEKIIIPEEEAAAGDFAIVAFFVEVLS